MFYAVAAFTAGPSGLGAYKQMEAEKQKQLENLRVLNASRSELESVKSALEYDEDTISVYARNLGYGGSDERFVRIVGLLSNPDAPEISAGEVYLYDAPIYKDDKTIRVIAIIIAAFTMFIIVITDTLLFIKDL